MGSGKAGVSNYDFLPDRTSHAVRVQSWFLRRNRLVDFARYLYGSQQQVGRFARQDRDF